MVQAWMLGYADFMQLLPQTHNLIARGWQGRQHMQISVLYLTRRSGTSCSLLCLLLAGCSVWRSAAAAAALVRLLGRLCLGFCTDPPKNAAQTCQVPLDMVLKHQHVH
jgi:hypothetical protein